MSGKMYCVGVGPGDPELMTVKAVRILEEADVLAYPYTDKEGTEAVALGIAASACRGIGNRKKVPVHVPMTRDRDLLEKSMRETAGKIRDALESGMTVAYITLGDPMIYSTYSSLGRFLKEWGYETEFVPGVPSFCAAAARLGTALVEGSESLGVIPSQRRMPAAFENETLVFMKAGSRMKELKESCALKDAEVMAVSNCGMNGEAVYYGTDDIPDDAGYFTTVIARRK